MSASRSIASRPRLAHEKGDCDRTAAVTKSLLGYLALAGPLYVVVSLVQALTRSGFDPIRDEWSLLALGHLGWIQMLNLVLTGAMVIAGAIGMRQSRATTSAERRWAPRLVAGYGAGLLVAGLFRADPANGFPAGAPDGPARQISTHGTLHLLGGSLGFACLIAACFVIARGMRQREMRRQAVVARAVGALFGLAFVGVASGDQSAAINLGFSAAVVLASGWLTSIAVWLYHTDPVDH